MKKPKPELDPDVADDVPWSDNITPYDDQHTITYLRLLDAERDQADWREAVQILFGLDPEREPVRCRKIHDAHLARARWMTEQGYRQLLSGGKSG